MILSKDKIAEFRAAAKPLMKWLDDNCHPHVTAIVECDSAELCEGVCIVAVDQSALCPHYSDDGCCADVEQSTIYCDSCKHVRKTVIVKSTMSADKANLRYGDRYGVDWEYMSSEEGA